MRFDPGQGQTSVLSIPRDLLVNIATPSGQTYANEKINAAYTIGSKLGGTKGGIVLAAETIEREVFPGLKLNGIVDVSFKGFIKVVADEKYGEILGVHIIGPDGFELIAEAVAAMEAEATVDVMMQTIHAHPTLYEAVGEAFNAVYGLSINA